MLFSQNMLENDKKPKKKKKKTKKKNKTPENFTLFDKKPCIFLESPENDKYNCEIWVFASNIAKDLVETSIKSVFSTENHEKIKEFKKIVTSTQEIKLKDSLNTPPNKEKEHRTVCEHIEHRKNIFIFY